MPSNVPQTISNTATGVDACGMTLGELSEATQEGIVSLKGMEGNQ